MWDPKFEDPKDGSITGKHRFLNNRYFMGFRGGEIQNNLWNYHPYDDVEEDEHPEKKEAEKGYHPATDKYRGGYFYPGNSWGRYLHINSIKGHWKEDGKNDFARYSWIVHPLAYRDWLNRLPDNSVDGIQWCVLNINTNEKHFGNKKEGWGICHGIELFNDFTYNSSYNADQTRPLTPFECPDFKIPCRNGGVMKTDDKEYHWWFNTYPFEFAEFLLVTALSRGVWLHPIAANDVGWQIINTISDRLTKEIISKQVGTSTCDTKYSQLPKTKDSSKEEFNDYSVEEHLINPKLDECAKEDLAEAFPYGK